MSETRLRDRPAPLQRLTFSMAPARHRAAPLAPALPAVERQATVVMVLLPTTNGIDAEAVPEVTGVPFTFMVAVALLLVGVMVTELTVLATVAV